MRESLLSWLSASGERAASLRAGTPSFGPWCSYSVTNQATAGSCTICGVDDSLDTHMP